MLSNKANVVSLQVKIRKFGSFRIDFVPVLKIDLFAIINTQTGKMQVGRRILYANFLHKLYMAVFRTWKKHYPRATLQIDDARATTVPSG